MHGQAFGVCVMCKGPWADLPPERRTYAKVSSIVVTVNCMINCFTTIVGVYNNNSNHHLKRATQSNGKDPP